MQENEVILKRQKYHTRFKRDRLTPVVPRQRSPLTYFVLTFAFSIPFWVVGAVSRLQLLPGIPVSALMLVAPVTAALIFVYREHKAAGVKTLLKRAFDFPRIQFTIWYLPTILLMPSIMVIAYVVMRMTGVALPNPHFSLITTLILFAVFFVTALCEELGWAGYVTAPLQARFGALGGALLLGVVWAVWHFIPLWEAQRSLDWIAWWSLGTLASRVIITWLYNNTGRSVFVATLFHTMMNLTWQLFPTNGAYSYYDPRVASLITLVVAVVVVIGWGPRTLMHNQGVRNEQQF